MTGTRYDAIAAAMMEAFDKHAAEVNRDPVTRDLSEHVAKQINDALRRALALVDDPFQRNRIALHAFDYVSSMLFMQTLSMLGSYKKRVELAEKSHQQVAEALATRLRETLRGVAEQMATMEDKP